MPSHDLGQPAAVPAGLARPSHAYLRRVWLATAALLLFLAAYLLLAGWFLRTAWMLSFGGGAGKDGLWAWVAAACAAFLGAFMVKGLFFLRRGSTEGMVELQPQQHPRLFEFLHALADRAGAPRPHKVFVSARVNAAVFYDLSPLNLLWPSAKNLEIGLGLVNAVTLGELRAVLAHEFGHFAQRAMAVGRWVYVAQQIAGHLVARRDGFDQVLRELSRFDLRIAWVGWLLSLVVWSIRAVVDTGFLLLLSVHRSLSREMELQADLVAVSLTGSDALIHALHKLQAADDAWERTLDFMAAEQAQGRPVADAFAVQAEVTEQMRRVLDDPAHGLAPPLPAEQPQQHRVFKAEIAQPPRMWLTHPLNHEREANAKRHYVAAPADERSAWEMFDGAAELREQLSAPLRESLGAPKPGEAPPAPVPTERSLQALRERFGREHLDRRYLGLYLGRPLARHAATPAELADTPATAGPEALDALYPPALAADMAQWRSLVRELAQLRALHGGALAAADGVIRHRGRRLERAQLPQAIAELEAEEQALAQRLQAHDRRCRGVHLALARQQGRGWPEHLQGLLALLHWCEHAEADMVDAHAALDSAVAAATATRRVSEKGRRQVGEAANELFRAFSPVYEQRHRVLPDPALLARLGADSWEARLGGCELPRPGDENLGDWIDVVGSWVRHAAGSVSVLCDHALDQVLHAEAQLAAAAREGRTLDDAPGATLLQVPVPLRMPGQARPRASTQGAWLRFQTADGRWAALARFAVAGAIVAGVLALGLRIGTVDIVVYNGLGRAVQVTVDDERLSVPPHAAVHVQRYVNRDVTLASHTAEGRLIEHFRAHVDGEPRYVYNVAGAAPLKVWTAVYGRGDAKPDRPLGAARWAPVRADITFEAAPEHQPSHHGGATLDVLSETARGDASLQLESLAPPERLAVLEVHMLWEPSESAMAPQWLRAAMDTPQGAAWLARRLAQTPDDVLGRREEQDSAGERRVEVCAQHRQQAAQRPEHPDWQYLAARCIDDPVQGSAAMAEGHRRWPQHGWFAYAHAYGRMQEGDWEAALAASQAAARHQPALAGMVAVDIVRLQRLLGRDWQLQAREFAQVAVELETQLALQGPPQRLSHIGRAYRALADGELAKALEWVNDEPQAHGYLQRLVAASDGASAEWVSHAVSGSPEGLNLTTAAAGLGAALRFGRNATAFEAVLRRDFGKQAEPLLAFAEALRQGRSPTEAEKRLQRVPLVVRGMAYSIGTVALQERAPAHWRRGAQRLLFPTERPWLGR